MVAQRVQSDIHADADAFRGIFLPGLIKPIECSEHGSAVVSLASSNHDSESVSDDSDDDDNDDDDFCHVIDACDYDNDCEADHELPLIVLSAGE